MVRIEQASHLNFEPIPIELYHFFITAFSAAPGVTYFGQLSDAYKSGLSIKDIVRIFTIKTQFTDVYSNSLSHNQLATKLVANIVGASASDSAKLQAINDITTALVYGLSVGDVIFNVFGNLATKPLSDSSWGKTAMQFKNQVQVAKFYTEKMNQSTTQLETLRDVLRLVTSDTDVSSDSAIATLIGVSLLGNGGG